LALVMGAPTALAFDPMPLNHQSGAVKITPTIELEQGYDDNVDQAPSGDTQSSWVTRLKPKVEASGQHQGNTYSLSYRPQLKSFDSENDRVRHTLNAQAEIRLNRRNQIKGRVNASRDQAAPNETNRAVGETEGNINKRGSFLATYTLGAENAAGELTTAASKARTSSPRNTTALGWVWALPGGYRPEPACSPRRITRPMTTPGRRAHSITRA
jgi:hypothetical protein